MKMRNKKIKIARNTQNWWGFTLQRGHAFGLYDGICYVSGGEPCPKKVGNILVYKQIPDRANLGHYYWQEISIPDKSELGSLMLNALYASPYENVSFLEPRFDTHNEWRQMSRYKQAAPKERKPAQMKHTSSVWDKRQAELRTYGEAEKKPPEMCYHDIRKWCPNFPTFRSRRAEYKPIPPAPRPQKTWVDQIIAKAQAK